MSIVVVGINHRTSPLDLLEKVTVSREAIPAVLNSLVACSDIREAVVLSTCNRTEVYAAVERFHAAYDHIRDFFCGLSGLSTEEVGEHLYSQHEDAAVAHLFSVTSGLDSAVLGETEIVGQVRDSWDISMKQGTSRSTLNLLFRHALEVGKRARTETGISRSTASVSHAAVEMAEEIHGSLQGARVLVVGAGEMGEGVAAALSRGGASLVTVVNRTRARGEALAEKVGAVVIDFDELHTQLANVDVVLTCTGGGEHIITVDRLRSSRQNTKETLLIVDIALPRDVEPAVAEMDGVTLRDLHDLSEWAARGLEQRATEAEEVRRIIGEEVQRFIVDQSARQAAPLVAELREAAESIRTAELARFSSRLADLSPEQQEVVDSVTKGIIAKLLHSPSVHLREAAGTPQGERLAAAVRDLFSLD